MLTTRTPPGLETPVRNHYFYGKLLDVDQFELETRYLNAKRWLLNRLVTGYGVVCGLDVLPGDETNEVWIGPGVALDKWGREIIVPAKVGPVVIPARFLPPVEEDDGSGGGNGQDDASDDGGKAGAAPHASQDRPAEVYDTRQRRGDERRRGERYEDDRPGRHRPDDDYGRGHGYGHDEDDDDCDCGDITHHGRWIQIRVCYDECEADPTPVFAGDCDTAQLCLPGTIRERFHLEFHEGRHPRPNPECLAPEFFPGDRLDYGALARYVTESCPDLPKDPCIVLANIRLFGGEDGHRCEPDNIDTTVRPVVYGNDLLFKLLLSDDDEEREPRDYREKG
jgi:hypothetical protein